MVFSGPWVMMTVRVRDGFDFGVRAIARATAGRSFLSGWPEASAHASASASFPMMMSQYGRSWSTCALKN